MENTNDEQEHTAKDDDFCSGLNGRRVAIKKSGYSIVDFGEDVISLFAIVIIVSIAAIISRTAAAIAASAVSVIAVIVIALVIHKSILSTARFWFVWLDLSY